MTRSHDDLAGRVERDEETGICRLQYEWTLPEPLDSAVVTAVAAAVDARPTEIESIDRAVDPDGLDSVFDPMWTDQARADGAYITFELEGCTVTVHRDGEIVVCPQG